MPTILIVVNDRSLCELMGLHLGNAGYQVVAAADPVAAGPVLLQRSNELDLVIVDSQLPYLSGVELVATLIADSTLPSLPMILLGTREGIIAENLGVPCLDKPFSADRLLELVRTTLRPAGAASAAAVRHEVPKLVANAP